MALTRHRHVEDDRAERDEQDVTTSEHEEAPEKDEAYEKFGGTNTGAAFFGWLVAVAVTALLTGIIGAVAAAVGEANNVTQDDAERQAGTVGLVSAVVLVVVLLVGYYAGGYVAGRMSRFDGARQGFWVWVIGVVATVVAVAVGWVFGAKYNVLDRVDLPRIPIPHDQLTWGGVIAGLVALVVTLLAATGGGKVGQHYHDRVDKYAAR